MSQMLELLEQSLYELIVETSTTLPSDAVKVINEGIEKEDPGTQSGIAMQTIRTNIAMAKSASQPLCQDTGMLSWYVTTPVGYSQVAFEKAARAAIVQATKQASPEFSRFNHRKIQR